MRKQETVVSAEERERVKASIRMHDKDVGSSQVQAVNLTSRILSLTEHMTRHKGDKHSRRGLVALVNRRRSLLKYLKRTDTTVHAKTIAALGLRK